MNKITIPLLALLMGCYTYPTNTKTSWDDPNFWDKATQEEMLSRVRFENPEIEDKGDHVILRTKINDEGIGGKECEWRSPRRLQERENKQAQIEYREPKDMINLYPSGAFDFTDSICETVRVIIKKDDEVVYNELCDYQSRYRNLNYFTVTPKNINLKPPFTLRIVRVPTDKYYDWNVPEEAW